MALNDKVALCVEDNPVNQNLLKAVLKDMLAEVILAADGLEGLEVFKREHGRIHIILTDLNMPGMDGEAMIRAIRAIDSEIPIVVVSSYSDVMKLEGVHGQIEKPFNKERIRQVIQSALSGRS